MKDDSISVEQINCFTCGEPIEIEFPPKTNSCPSCGGTLIEVIQTLSVGLIASIQDEQLSGIMKSGRHLIIDFENREFVPDPIFEKINSLVHRITSKEGTVAVFDISKHTRNKLSEFFTAGVIFCANQTQAKEKLHSINAG